MKKLISLLLVLVLGASFAVGCASGAAKSFTIAVPNDPTNEARALRLLEANGLIKLKEGSGETATKLDIAENPYILDFQGDIYHQKMRIEFIEFLRPEEKFNSVDELVLQMRKDKVATFSAFSPL